MMVTDASILACRSGRERVRRIFGAALLAAPALLAPCAGSQAANPCTGIDRSLTAPQKAAYGRAVASELHVAKVTVLQSFRFAAWCILYVETGNSDETFFFFAGDPTATPFVTRWSGGAAPSEQVDIRAWTVANAAGIPARLAACFAWHVTNDRDQ